MTRRSFVPAAVAAGMAGSAQGQQQAGRNAYIEIGIVHLRNTHENQRQRVVDHWKNTVLPARLRAGAGPIGVFGSSIGPDGPFILTVTSYPTFASYEEVNRKLVGDREYLNAALAFDAQPGLAYQRVESSLLRAFDGMPAVEPPAGDGKRPPKVFEVRIYESNNFSTLGRKMKMFNEGEIGIFRRLGMAPVFFGQTVFGRNMPNLVYMLAYNDMAHRDQCWRAFGGDPEWKKLRDTPGYSDAEIVSNITNYIVTPMPFSQIR